MEESAQKKDCGRVLFTGNGEYLIDNLMDRISAYYKLVKCPAVAQEFSRAMERLEPHALVVCLMQESAEAYQMYQLLETDERYSRLPILVIGKDEDCNDFKRYVKSENVSIFLRPVNVEHIQTVLREQVAAAIVAEAEREIAGQLDVFRDDEDDEQIDAAEPPAKAAVQETVAEVAAGGNRQNILVVDDDVRMLNTIKLFLQDLYDVTVVPSGKLALRFLEKKHADLVLLDYMMPEMDGPEVLRQIRASSKPNLPVLFLTSIADKNMVMRGIAQSPNGYLLKPIEREALIERVTAALLGL